MYHYIDNIDQFILFRIITTVNLSILCLFIRQIQSNVMTDFRKRVIHFTKRTLSFVGWVVFILLVIFKMTSVNNRTWSCSWPSNPMIDMIFTIIIFLVECTWFTCIRIMSLLRCSQKLCFQKQLILLSGFIRFGFFLWKVLPFLIKNMYSITIFFYGQSWAKPGRLTKR